MELLPTQLERQEANFHVLSIVGVSLEEVIHSKDTSTDTVHVGATESRLPKK